MLLKVDHIAKRFGKVEAVTGLSLSVEPQEIVALLGPNGAGKTTSIHMVAGLVKPDAGSVILRDYTITKMPLHKRAAYGLALLPQSSASFDELTVEQNLKAILELTPCSKEERQSRFEKLVEQVRIGDILDRKYTVLSGGERRRVEIAKTLTGEPSIILLDEPFAGLDPKIVEDLQGLMKDLAAQGIGILITDHNVHMALQVVDRAYVMHRGRVVSEGGPQQIANDPEVKEVYLGEGFVLS